VSLIETREGAERLARAIATDIRRYAGEKLVRGEDVSDEIGEGRALFQARVIPDFYPLLDAALAELLRSPGVTAATLAPVDTSPPSALPVGLFRPAPTAAPPRARGALLLGILLNAAAVGWWLAMR
jgi:hypothetical protein